MQATAILDLSTLTDEELERELARYERLSTTGTGTKVNTVKGEAAKA